MILESGSHCAPQPTPRLTKSIHSDASTTSNESTIIKSTASATTTTATTNTHVITRAKNTVADESSQNESIDRSSGDYTETKKFWQSLESGTPVDESLPVVSPPVPKPRSQSIVSSSKSEDKSDQLVTLSSGSGSEDHTNQSSLPHEVSAHRESLPKIPFGASPSVVHSEEDKIEDESFPFSERLEQEYHIESLDFDGTERSDSSMYKIKEREDILDLDEHDDTEAIALQTSEAADDVADNENAASFYIGESSVNIITKSSTEKRSEFAFDNAGYETTQDSAQNSEYRKDSTETQEYEQPEQDAFAKQVAQELDFSIGSSIDKTYEFLEAERGMRVADVDAKLEKSDLEYSEKQSLSKTSYSDESSGSTKAKSSDLIHTPVEGRKTFTEIEQLDSLDSDISLDQIKSIPYVNSPVRSIPPTEPSSESPIEIGQAEADSADASAFISSEPIVSFPVETPPAEEDVSFEQPKRAPVIHSPVESRYDRYAFDEQPKSIVSEPEEELQHANEIRSPAQSVHNIAGTVETVSIDDNDIFSRPHKAAVVHSPIDTAYKCVTEVERPTELDTNTTKSFATMESVSQASEPQDDSGFFFDMTAPKKAAVVHSPVQQTYSYSAFVEEKPIPEGTASTERDDRDDSVLSPRQEVSASSNEGSSNKLDVVHRKTTAGKVTTTARWSVTDPENYSSSGSHYDSLENSRPCSSDVENLYASYANSSAEYQTAQDASFMHPGSTEYHTAVSSLDHSGKTISSHESMKSFDSESSGHLGSREVSEASETLVPSTSELDFDECEQKLASLDACSGILMDDAIDNDLENISPHMKRSQEMIFQPDLNQLESIETMTLSSLEKSDSIEKKASEEDIKCSYPFGHDEVRLATSLEEGSILSTSLSSTDNVDTIVENIQEDMATSFGSSLIGSYETQSLLKDDMTGTSFDEQMRGDRIESITMTSSFVQEDDVSSVNTQITTDAKAEGNRRGKGHKRNDSTSFIKTLDLGKMSTESTDSSSLDEEMVIHELEDDERKESGSDSDYDRYETEYSRSFRQPTKQRKKKSLIEKKIEKPESEIERKKSVPSIETIVEDVIAEVEIEPEEERAASQNMMDFSNIPDIMITDDPTKFVSDDEEESAPPAPSASTEVEREIVGGAAAASKQDKPTASKRATTVKYANESEVKISDEQYQQLIDRQYKTTESSYDSRDDIKTDSPTSDSFEMVDQPDISDEFVIIEEVAKEADELMTEGKSVIIKSTKYVKKHDDEVEKILVKSAPAATNEGSTILQGRHDLAFEFEESPPSGGAEGARAGGADGDGQNLESSRKWVEMQLAEQAQNLRYPYDMERGILEDIKEEDTDLDVGSSRISSFRDSSFSSSDFDAIAAGRRYVAKEHDNVSMSSLQEFESLEQAISLENRKFHQGSQESLSNGSFPKRNIARSAQADDISLASLKEFEGLENACLEAHLIEIKAKEEHALLLSRSDESNKSNISDKDSTAASASSASGPGGTGGKVSKIIETTTTVVTKAMPGKSMEYTTTEFQSQPITVVTEIRTKTSRFDEPDEDFSSSNLMEVSTDSLELGPKQTKQSAQGKGASHHGSSDSLEISKSADVMTSSIDSIEISKGKSSTKSEADSIEQFGSGRMDSKRDSIDSIEMQYALMDQATKTQRDSIDGNAPTTIVTYARSIMTTTTTTTSAASSSGYGGGISKDISSDSLNINQSEPELLLTSTESLDHTTSSTNATYQNETDSQMTMSGSMTSCDSNTLVDTLDTVHTDLYQATVGDGDSSRNLLLAGIDVDDKFGTRTTTTTTTTTIYKRLDQSDDNTLE